MDSDGSKKRKRMCLPKDSKKKDSYIEVSSTQTSKKKVSYVDLSSNRKSSLRSSEVDKEASTSKNVNQKKDENAKGINDDDDFVSAPVVNKVKKVMVKKDITYRNPANVICQTYLLFSEKQREVINDIGFGFVKDFVVKGFKRELCTWVLQNYDSNRKVLRVNNHDIHITRQGVHDVYGLPMGKIPLHLPFKSRFADPVIRKWRKQFPKDEVTRIRTKNVRSVLENSADYGEMFKLNFLVLYVTSMIEGPATGACNQKFLENFGEDVDFKEFDWCRFVIESLNQSQENFNLEDKSQFTGPVAFLVLLYLHSTKIDSESGERVFPATSFWSPDEVKKRLDALAISGGYGNVEVILDYKEFVENAESDDEHIPLRQVMKNRIKTSKINKDNVVKKRKQELKKKSEVHQVEVPVVKDGIGGDVADSSNHNEFEISDSQHIPLGQVMNKRIKMSKNKDDVVKEREEGLKKNPEVHQVEVPVVKNGSGDVEDSRNDHVLEENVDVDNNGSINGDSVNTDVVTNKFDIVMDSSRNLQEFKVKIDYMFLKYHSSKKSIDDWIIRAWDQLPDNEVIRGYAKKRNLEFSKCDDKLVLVSIAEVTENVPMKVKDSNLECSSVGLNEGDVMKVKDSNLDCSSVGLNEGDAEKVNFEVGGVDPNQSTVMKDLNLVGSSVGIHETPLMKKSDDPNESRNDPNENMIDPNELGGVANVEGSVVDFNNLTLTQVLEDPMLCNEFEKSSLAAIQSKANIGVGNEEVSDEKLKEMCNILSEMQFLDPNSGVGIGDSRTPKNAIPLNTSSVNVKEPMIFSPILLQSFSAEEAGTSKAKRVMKPAPVVRSPYYKVDVDSFERVKPIERRVAGALFFACRDAREKVFESHGIIGVRAVMESMIPGCRIHYGVIDAWSVILNIVQKHKKHTHPSRFFMPCSPMVLLGTSDMSGLGALLREMSNKTFRTMASNMRLSSKLQDYGTAGPGGHGLKDLLIWKNWELG